MNLEYLTPLDLVFLEDEALAVHKNGAVVFLLNSSATSIVRLAHSGFGRDEIVEALANYSGLPQSEIEKDIATLEHTVQGQIGLTKASKSKKKEAAPLDPPLLSAVYTLFGRRAQIDYPNHQFARFLHPYFAPFQIDGAEAELLVRFDFNVDNSVCVVRCDQAEYKAPASAAKSIGAVCQALLFHDKPKQPTLNVFMHCGGIIGSRGAWLIGGASGRGKSTMVATLDAAGHTILSDDILPIDPKARLAYPMPFSMSIKAGSWDHIANMRQDQTLAPIQKTPIGKTVRMIAPLNPPRDADRAGIPIAGFLFPDRHDDGIATIEPISTKNALMSLCDVFGRFPTKYADLQALADCVEAVPRYKLRYRDAGDLMPILAPLL